MQESTPRHSQRPANSLQFRLRRLRLRYARRLRGKQRQENQFDRVVIVMNATNEDEPFPIESLLDLLIVLWRAKMSVNTVDQLTVNVYPAPDEWLAGKVQHYYEPISALLPGICDGCQSWVINRVSAYWGAHPHLCPDCTDLAVKLFEKSGIWPQANIFDGEV